jgi:hypothetical protein
VFGDVLAKLVRPDYGPSDRSSVAHVGVNIDKVCEARPDLGTLIILIMGLEVLSHATYLVSLVTLQELVDIILVLQHYSALWIA